jgi:transcriptional/translational regulatory protein YebC/TACO1
MNEEYKKAKGKAPAVIFLQNHGVFVGANSADEINAIYDDIMSKLKAFYASKNVTLDVDYIAELDMDAAAKVQKLIDRLEEDDDVQNVYTNADFPEGFEG